jgi:hypothetical protein
MIELLGRIGADTLSQILVVSATVVTIRNLEVVFELIKQWDGPN